MTFLFQSKENSWNMGWICGCSETSPITAQHGLTILIKENIEGMPFYLLLLAIEQPLFICKTRFEYTSPRIRLTPKDLEGTKLEKPKILHFICSPSRAIAMLTEVEGAWKPITIFEPIPVRPSNFILFPPA